MRRRRNAVQVVIREMPGPELWYRVEHASGWFKLPAIANIEDLFQGAREGWSSQRRGKLRGEALVRVPLSTALGLPRLKSETTRDPG
jgi:hypothetical protein